MSERIQKTKEVQEREAEVEEAPGAVAADNSETLQITDDLLDEIDSVLEVNAEEFIKSFRQKGGQ